MTTRLRQRWLLAVLVACELMANVDIAIVNVATPSIDRDLHASGGALEFVVSGYVLAFAMLIITGARLGRIAGYRRVYLACVAGFTFASLACSLAPGTGALIGARIAQGACAAVMVPQVLTGIQVSFDGRARARALSVLVMTMFRQRRHRPGARRAAHRGGRVRHGLAVDLLGQRAGRRRGAGGRGGAAAAGEPREGQAGLAGVGLLTAAMALLVTPLAFGREQGWPAWTWACLGASVVAFAGFAAFERRLTARGGDPVINLRLLARPVVAWELTANFARTSTYFAMLFVLAQYLQQGLGRSATYSGLVLVSWVAAFGIAAPVTRRLPTRVAPFGGVLGSLILASAFAAVSAAPAPGPFLDRGAGRGRVRSRDGVQLAAWPSHRRGPAGRGRRPERASQHLGSGRRGGRSGGLRHRLLRPGGPAGLRVRRGHGDTRGERVRGRGLLVPVRPAPRRRGANHTRWRGAGTGPRPLGRTMIVAVSGGWRFWHGVAAWGVGGGVG